jgi:peptidoglycan/LPS O-acetylase OafA/YrhL
VLLSPLFAVFGWFYIFPIFVLVAVMWGSYGGRLRAVPWRIAFVLSGIVIGGGIVALLGIHSRGDQQMHDGLVFGGSLAGGFATLCITFLKDREPNQAIQATAATPGS